MSKNIGNYKYYYQGIGYNNFTMMVSATNCGMSVTTVKQRMAEGMAFDEAIASGKRKTGTVRTGSHIVEGVEYASLPAVQAAYPELNLNTLFKRAHRGMTGDDLIPTRLRKDFVLTVEPEKIKPIKFYVGDQGFTSQREAVEYYGVKMVTFRARLRAGQTSEQALGVTEVIDKRAGSKDYMVNGEFFTMSELSNRFNVPVRTVRDRLQRGATTRQAIGLDSSEGLLKQRSKPATKRNTWVKVFGITYPSLTACAEAHGFKNYVISQRINDYGYTLEEALTATGKCKPVTVDGKLFNSMAAACKAYNMNYESVQQRIAAGWSIEQALTFATYSSPSRQVEYKGVTYKSLHDLAAEVGIPHNRIQARRTVGKLSLAEAIDKGVYIRSVGRYNLTILERDPELANTPSELYFVRLKIDGEYIYKIGITTRTSEDRMRDEGYKFRVLRRFKSTLIDCYNKEKELHQLFDEFNAGLDSSIMSGHTECFVFDEQQIGCVHAILDDYESN